MTLTNPLGPPAASNSLAGVMLIAELFNELHVVPPLKQLRDNKAV